MVRVKADPKQKPTDEQIKMLQAASRPIQFDEDCLLRLYKKRSRWEKDIRVF